MQSYKVSSDDALAMAKQWYAMAGVANPSQKALAHWTTQIQQDGSQPSFDLFKTGKGQDSADAFNPQTLAQNATAYTAKSGKQPYTPTSGQFAGQNQLPGTNHKTAVAEAQEPVGNFLKNIAPVAGLIPGIGPLLAAGIGGLGQAIIPGANLGNDMKQGAISGAEGLAAGTAGGLLNNALGIGSGAGSAATGAIPDAATMSPTDLAAAANAGAGAGAGGGIGGFLSGSGLTTGDLLKLGGSALTAGTNYAANQAALAEKQREFNQEAGMQEGQQAVATQNRLNTAPLADQSQYMLKNLMTNAPTPFQPRDFTQTGNLSALNTPASGGAAKQLAANAAAASNYTPGAGGVDTSQLNQYLGALTGQSSAYGGMSQTPGSGTTQAKANTAPSAQNSTVDPSILALLKQRLQGSTMTGTPTYGPTYAGAGI